MSNLYVDDVREVPGGWDSAKSFHEAIYMLEKEQYTELSLDHDLGCFYGNKEMTGYDILMWLIDRKRKGIPGPSSIKVHSANPVGRERMEQAIGEYFKK